MAEKIKKVKATNVGELMHHYVAAVNDYDTRGDYKYTGDKFYIDDSCVCKIISRDKKVAIIHPFDRSGGWGGYSHHNLIKSFPNDWTILTTNWLQSKPDKIEEFEVLTFKSIILETIYEEFVNIVTVYVREKYLITSNSFRDFVGYSSIKLDKLIISLCKKFKVPKKDIINHIYNSKEWITVNWSGWGKEEKEVYKIDKPIKFYLDKSKWHTVKELDILEFKKWKSKYFNLDAIASGAYYRQGRTYEEIWKDKEFKAEYEKNIEAGNNLYKHNKELKRQHELEQTLAKEKEKVDKWLKGDSIGNLWKIPIHLRIKDNRIETTRNAVIPLEAGKLLFKLFNKVRQGSTDNVYDSNKFKVGFYEFNKIHYVGEHWFVVVGCHHLRDTEIDLFINQYNLEEWKQMK